MVALFLKRLKEVISLNENFAKEINQIKIIKKIIFNENIEIQELISLDDYFLWSLIDSVTNIDKNDETLKELGNQPIESITFKDIEKYLDEGSNIIRVISDNITIRKSAKGEYIFYKSGKMKKPVFFNFKGFEEDYKNCDINILKNWLKETHKVF
jgi:hypothetical protein